MRAIRSALLIPVALVVACGAFATASETEPIVKNGDFETANSSGKAPAFWQPLRQGYRWEDIGGAHGYVLRFDIPGDVAPDRGFQFYSQKNPIRANQRYRCSFDLRSDGPHVALYLHFYGLSNGKERRIYRRHIKSTNRVETDGEWKTLEFLFTASQPPVMDSPVLERRKAKDLGQVKVEAQFIIFGDSRGTLEVDNLRIEPVSVEGAQTRATRPTRTEPKAAATSKAASKPTE